LKLIAKMKYPAKYFAFVRIALGIFFLFNYIYLFPYAIELFSSAGLLGGFGPLTTNTLPNILAHNNTPQFIQLYFLVLIAASATLALGIYRQPSALILWYGLASLLNINPYIINPAFAYVGWLLLAMAVIPLGEPYTLLRKHNSNWEMPKLVVVGAWLVFGASYTVSGITKLVSPSWVNGETLDVLLNSTMANGWFIADWARLLLPLSISHILTWGILWLEILCLPLCFWQLTRKYTWLLLTAAHVGILLILNIGFISVGMLVFHLFLFNTAWWPKIHIRVFGNLAKLSQKIIRQLNNGPVGIFLNALKP